MKRIYETMAATELFCCWNKESFHDYYGQTTIKLADKGEILINEGDSCTKIGVVIDGQLALQKYTSTGDFTTLGLLGSGESFGEDLIFSGIQTYSNTIEAVTNSKILYISREMIITNLTQNPAVMLNFLTILSKRLQSQRERICLLSQKSLRLKIANYLLDLLRVQSEQKKASPNIFSQILSTQAVELPVSKEVVARLLAMPRPSFSRELISMAHDGLIRVNGRVIWLTDLDRLEQGTINGF